MAKVYITEYARRAVDSYGQSIQAGEEPPVATQTVAIGAEAKSNAFNVKTTFVRVHTDAICSVLFGVNPTADANSPRMAANQTEYFAVLPLSGMKLSVITNT